MLQLVLASQSPRRRELLRDELIDFRTCPVKVSENIDENLNLEENASQIATVKVLGAVEQNKLLKSHGFLVLSADTVVGVGDKILGKPRNAQEALEFLRLLSGKTHRVVTGLALYETGLGRLWSGAEVTLVTFRPLSDPEIQTYIQTGEPMDKAGAYGIQGQAAKFVSETIGSYSNVVGLPIELLKKVCKDMNWALCWKSESKNS